MVEFATGGNLEDEAPALNLANPKPYRPWLWRIILLPAFVVPYIAMFLFVHINGTTLISTSTKTYARTALYIIDPLELIIGGSVIAGLTYGGLIILYNKLARLRLPQFYRGFSSGLMIGGGVLIASVVLAPQPVNTISMDQWLYKNYQVVDYQLPTESSDVLYTAVDGTHHIFRVTYATTANTNTTRLQELDK
jgi:hypothetical protein